MSRAYEALRRWTQRHHTSWIARTLMRFSRVYCEAFEHPGYDIVDNGEARMLARLSSASIRTAWDVGANIGDWTEVALHAFPEARIDAFEPFPETAHRLAMRHAGPRVRVHTFGLGLRDGPTPFTYYGIDYSFLSSAVNHTQVVPGIATSVEMRRSGACFAELLETPPLDILKLDVEGMEYDVLVGLGDFLAPPTIRFIQFEHHGGYRPLQDFYTLLEPRGYRVGKIYARHVDFSTYDRWKERYAGPNYLAVPVTESALMARLSAS
jgi:FkbM family methyltransferase